MERTFVMVKPDGVQRQLVGEVIRAFERRGLKIVGLKMVWITPELAARHYAEHRDKPFFQGLVQFITSGPVVVMVLEGRNCISLVREMMGATDPARAAAGTIRGSYGIDIGRNLVHGSDSPASAAREIPLFFREEELFDYSLSLAPWIYE
ncbi:MAG: nucleoside-diphosphate kinase [Firmicutes bacterium]|nr:nucleoside-diphosphate kinase [Bacillota bacterium]